MSMKKLISMVLALVMLLAMSATAFAEGDDGENSTTYTITIKNKNPGHIYEAYQIFTGDLSKEAVNDSVEGTSAVLSNIVWGDGVTCPDAGIVINGAATKDAAKIAEALADGTLDAKAFVKQLTLGKYTTSGAQVNDTYKIVGLEPGYYLVKDKDDSLDNEHDAYTDFIIEVVENSTVSPKSSYPTVEKKVWEDENYTIDGGYGEGYNDVADHDIGKEVPFQIYSSVPDMSAYSTYTMKFFDTMTAGLTMNEASISVKIGNKTLTKNEDYSVTSTEHSFELTINDLKTISDINMNDPIVVSYTATLNSNAVIGLDGNTNEVYLKYSNNPNESNDMGKTPEDKVIVFTYGIEVDKYDDANQSTKLPGAKFVLKNSDGTKYATFDKDNKLTGWVTDEDDATELVTDSHGRIEMKGLDEGTYKLEETEAPVGYNLLGADVTITITATTVNGQKWAGVAANALTSVENDSDNDQLVEVGVANNAGATLPETGAQGTKMLYIVGGILVAAAVILLITKRRMDSAE